MSYKKKDNYKRLNKVYFFNRLIGLLAETAQLQKKKFESDKFDDSALRAFVNEHKIIANNFWGYGFGRVTNGFQVFEEKQNPFDGLYLMLFKLRASKIYFYSMKLHYDGALEKNVLPIYNIALSDIKGTTRSHGNSYYFLNISTVLHDKPLVLRVDGKDKLLYYAEVIELLRESKSSLQKAVKSQIPTRELSVKKAVQKKKVAIQSHEYYVDPKRVEELKSIDSEDFDFRRLIKYLNELNSSYKNENYFACIFLLRSILDHVPPIFGVSNFDGVINNYNPRRKGKGLTSFAKMMLATRDGGRNLADEYLHKQIGKNEVMPNKIQVDFRSGIDRLIAEVVYIMKTKE